VLLEAIKREKQEKAAFARLLVELEIESGRVSRDKAVFLLIQYEEELHQFKYNYKYVPVEHRLKALQENFQDEDANLLDKVSNLSVRE